jgi:hypothetical protein
MSDQQWHPGPGPLSAYAAGEGDVLFAASVETHLARCKQCRDVMRSLASTAVVDRGRELLDIALPVSRYPLAVRLAQRLGLRDTDALLVAESRAMSTAWVVSAMVVLAFALAASSLATDSSEAVFLLLAPLVPVLGVSITYATTGPTLAQLAAASPYSTGRLLLLRTASVLVPCLPVCLLAGAAVRAPLWLLVAWLLPSLACALTVLALSTWVSVELSGAGVALVWALVVASGAWRHDVAQTVAADLQPIYLGLAVVAGALIAARARRHVTPGGVA